MAECAMATVPSQSHLRRARTQCNLVQLRNAQVKVYQSFICRNCIKRSQVIFNSAPPSLLPVRSHPLECFCIQSLVSSEIPFAPSWVALADQALLTVSIILAYLAGVIPKKRSFLNTRRDNGMSSQSTSFADTLYGRADKYKSKDLWSEAQNKLSKALEEKIQTGELKSEKCNKHGPLSLFALDLDPRLRLLAITLQKLQDEVNCILHDAENLAWEKWLVVSADLIKGLVPPVFIKWIEEEQALEKNQPYKKLSDVVTRKLKEDDRIIRKFNSSGKAELYGNLIFFLRFGFVRNPSYYDTKFFTEHGIQILEDMLIFLADGIASVYLELISVDGDWYSEEMDSSSTLVLCSLSTRALQKLRNEVALNWWLNQYFESIVSMYEDRFELYIMCQKERENTNSNLTNNINWWRVGFSKPASHSSGKYIQLVPFSLSVKRTKELRALTGWRYYFSLYLELSDISLPLIKGAFTNISNAISYFLTYIIGRSLGLIFSGIRQALGWR
ncbi:hypothetical protein LUZ63_005433 [Rhynchospora breviuscula]|uniref:Uncharacterized protein n=1 Tax=Rhynchospora breviuscula TaxID=2022672 RepID=A0A9Q0CMX4_9POAL|nr:hypothetical protein LUZ63_005433 [Rhynchospora breviuscula]